MSRINFEVDDEDRIEIQRLQEATGARTQRDLFLQGVGWLARIRRAVEEQHLAVVAIQIGHLEHLAARLPGAVEVLAYPRVVGHRWLVSRPGWRSTPWFKGRRLHVGDVVHAMEANDYTQQEVADELELPLEAVAEALAYCRSNRELLDAEDREAALRAQRTHGESPRP